MAAKRRARKVDAGHDLIRDLHGMSVVCYLHYPAIGGADTRRVYHNFLQTSSSRSPCLTVRHWACRGMCRPESGWPAFHPSSPVVPSFTRRNLKLVRTEGFEPIATRLLRPMTLPLVYMREIGVPSES